MAFTLRKVLWMIVLFAVVLAIVPVPLAIVLSVVLSGIASSIVVIAAVCGVSKVRGAMWVTAVYPWLILASLYLTWLAARWTLGHIPRPLIDDPKFISEPILLLRDLTWVLLFGIVPAAIACLLLVIYESVLTVEHNRANRPNEVAKLVLIPLLLWLGASAIFALDPGHSLDWLLD